MSSCYTYTHGSDSLSLKSYMFLRVVFLYISLMKDDLEAGVRQPGTQVRISMHERADGCTYHLPRRVMTTQSPFSSVSVSSRQRYSVLPVSANLTFLHRCRKGDGAHNAIAKLLVHHRLERISIVLRQPMSVPRNPPYNQTHQRHGPE